MDNKLTAKSEAYLDASPAKVWEALTTPELIKKWLFGTEVNTDWKVGSPITYTGSWEGKTYEDKGKILEFVPEKVFSSTYWSSMSGKENKPENYATVTYKLEPEGEGTNLSIIQDNNSDEKSKEHSEANWDKVMVELKKILQ